MNHTITKKQLITAMNKRFKDIPFNAEISICGNNDGNKYIYKFQYKETFMKCNKLITLEITQSWFSALLQDYLNETNEFDFIATVNSQRFKCYFVD